MSTRTAPQKFVLRNIFLTIIGAAVLIFLFLPLVVMVIYSFNTGRLLASWNGFGFSAYGDAVSNPTLTRAVLVSLVSALVSALLATVMGTLAGLGLARASRAWWASALTGLLLVTLVSPEIVDGISLLPWFVTLGADAGLAPMNNGMVRLVIVQTTFSLAVVTFIVRARMAGLNRSLDEAATDLYASPFARFRQITLPLAAPAIISGGLLAFTLSLDTTVVSSFVQLPGYTPWPVYILGSLKVGLRPEIAAMSTMMLVLTLLAIAIVAVVLRRSGQSVATLLE